MEERTKEKYRKKSDLDGEMRACGKTFRLFWYFLEGILGVPPLHNRCFFVPKWQRFGSGSGSGSDGSGTFLEQLEVEAEALLKD